MAAVAASEGAPLIPLKGLTTYAITGDERTLRASSDVDVLFEDFERARPALLKAGYTLTEPAAPHECANPHELIKIHRDGVLFDVHNHFPVWSYPPGIQEADVNPECAPSVLWRQNVASRTERDIRYEHLLVHSTRSRAPEAAGLLVPTLAMSAVILCAHEFKEFIEGPFTQSFVKLSVLAEIRDVCTHSAFDLNEFLTLVDEFEAHDAVLFCGCLLEALLGSNPLPDVGAASHASAASGFPQLLHFLGTWACVSGTEDVLMARDASALISDRLMASDTISMKTEPMPATQTGPLIIQGTHAQAVQVSVETSSDTEQVRLAITLSHRGNAPFSGCKVQARVSWHGLFAHSVLFTSTDPLIHEEGIGSATVTPTYDGYSISITLPFTFLPPGLLGKESAPFVVFVAEWDRALGDLALGLADPIAALPLTVRL